MVALPEDATTEWSSVECHSASIGDHDIPFHETGCTSAGLDTSLLSTAHADVSTDETSIMILNAENANVDEHSCKQIMEAPVPISGFPGLCLPVHDESPLRYGLESESDNGRDEAGYFSPSVVAGEDAAAGRISQELHHALTAAAKYRCVTQRHGCAEVRVGWDDEIPRWRRGSELTYVVCVESFPDPLSNVVEGAMKAAIDKWQEDSFVSFKQVHRDDPATFAVTYQNWDGKPYACSFFPNDRSRKLMVFAKSLQVPDCLVNILAHEVGHILGLRHEFAHTHKEEKECPSVLVGRENTQSVMNYFEHPKQLQVQETDLEGLKSFYENDKAEYEGLPIRDLDPKTCLFWGPSRNHLVSSVKSAAVDKKQIPVYPNLYWLNADTTMPDRPDIPFFVFFMLFMILTTFILILFLLLYLACFSFLLS